MCPLNSLLKSVFVYKQSDFELMNIVTLMNIGPVQSFQHTDSELSD